jgi:Otopetrin
MLETTGRCCFDAPRACEGVNIAIGLLTVHGVE